MLFLVKLRKDWKNKMRKEMKEELNLVFQAPAPQRKEQFLQQFYTKRISNFEFLLIQLGYIKKWIILISMVGLPYFSLC